MGSLPANAGSNVVLIDPTQPERVYAAADSALYRSDDAGQTWETVGQGLPDGGIAALALDPRQPQWLYVAADEGELYTSEDGGTTWRALADAAS